MNFGKTLLYLMALNLLYANTLYAKSPVKMFGIMIGSNLPGPGQDQLNYAHEDARRIKSTFKEMGRYASYDFELLFDPDTKTVMNALDKYEGKLKIEKNKGEKTIFIFYYSGHARAQGFNLGHELLSLKYLRSKLEKLPSTVTLVFLDACQAGAFSVAKGVSPAKDFSYNSVMDLNSKGMAVLASSSDSELSQESPKLKGSFFSHHLAVGLRGAADIDNDGIVTLSEAYTYAYHKTLRTTAHTSIGPQHVTLETNLQGQGDLAIAWPGIYDTALILPANLTGEVFLVHQDSQNVVAQIYKAKGESFRVALKPGNYEAIIRLDEKKGKKCNFTAKKGNNVFSLAGCSDFILDKEVPKGVEVVYRDIITIKHPRDEIIFAETFIGSLFAGATDYTNKLEDFDYHGQNEGNGFLTRASLLYSPWPFISIGAVISGLDHRKGSNTFSGTTKTLSWRGFRVGGFLRGNLAIKSRLFLPYIEFGAGFAKSILSFKGLNSIQAEDKYNGHFISGAAGLQWNPKRHFGFTLLHLEYIHAPVLKMKGTLDEKHNNGGFALMSGIRFGY